MILTDVLTSCDLNPLYYNFIPSFIKAWKILFPTINIHIILIAHEIPPNFLHLKQYIHLFKPLPNIPTSFTSQNIRLLYPSLLFNSIGGILITDIDIIPMNSKYYIENIQNIHNNKFVCYRQLNCVGPNEMVICYNIAHYNIWQNIFKIFTLNDLKITLFDLYNNNKYIGHLNMPFWITDQLYLYEKTQLWNKYSNNLIILNDFNTGFKRLDRNNLPPISLISSLIINKQFTDYHMLRPYDTFKNTNDTIIELLNKQSI